MAELRLFATVDASGELLAEIRELLDDAFEGEFSDDDWTHTIGGMHAIVVDDDRVVAHGSVVGRLMRVGDQPWHVGYVEGVATCPSRQREGHGARVMCALNTVIRSEYPFGVLSTGEHQFYDRLGWEPWRGPTFVRLTSGELLRTADEDDGIMVLRNSDSSRLDLTLPLSCDERDGDDW